jgi:tRNA (guanine37-N1)-methyltransferase
MKLPKSYDVIGNIAILKFEREKREERKKIAEILLKKRKNIKTVVEKVERVKGRLRTFKTRWLAGVKTTETLHVESGCKFKLDIEKTYFSPRLSNERLEIAGKIKKKDKVLVMFAGVGPYSIIIAEYAKPKKVVSVEINQKASGYAKENVNLNKLENVEVVQGDVKKIIPQLVGKKIKFDKIVMPRPQLRESFLNLAFSVAKKNSEIYYYDFGSDVGKVLERIFKESKKARKKINVEKVKKAGEIAPFKYRWRIDLRVN